MNLFMTLFTLLTLLVACPSFIPSVHADEVSDLASYFQQEITTVTDSVCSESDEADSSDSSSMTLQDINVDISPSVTFGISSVLSLSVSPEIDLVFVPEDANP